jgi:hypothetical protein
MYDYVRVILILYKPPSEEDEFLTLCFRPQNPKYFLRARYSPRLTHFSQLLPRTQLSPQIVILLPKGAKENGSDVQLRGLSELQINCCFPCMPDLSWQAKACSN